MLPIPEGKKYHIFLAHSGRDTEIAVLLRRLLGESVSVFLDCESLLPGDAWDTEIPKAQQESLITVVLISEHIERSFYQQEEVAGAIELSRTAAHRVVPVYLNTPGSPVPYGLRRIHSIQLAKEGSLSSVAVKLLGLVEKIAGPVRVSSGSDRERDLPELIDKPPLEPYWDDSYTNSRPELEVSRTRREGDYLSVIPGYADPWIKNQEFDQTSLFARFAGIEVVNHDVNPAEIQHLWLGLRSIETGRDLLLVEVRKEELTGDRRIAARSKGQYELKVECSFEGAPPPETLNLVLCVKAIGLGETSLIISGPLGWQI